MQVLKGKEEGFHKSSAACEKAETCEMVSKACFELVVAETLVCDPRRRWIYCYAWKTKLGMVFDKDLGVYILPDCPYCGKRLKEALMERAI